MPSQALLLLHPHPLHGGTMGNKVITAIARVARDNGLANVAFHSKARAEVLENGIMVMASFKMQRLSHPL